jgi:cytoskeleton protein RodZ
VTRPEAEIQELPTDPGARLRRQRELAGLSEQQVAEQLNLDAAIVTALETDDFASLGAPVFARGHLKRYAALLGVAEDEVLGAYDRSRARVAQPSLIPRAREEMMPVRGRPKWPWLVGGVVLFLLAAAIAAYVSEYGLRLPGQAGEGPVQQAGQQQETRGGTATASGTAAAAPRAAAPAPSVPGGPVAAASTTAPAAADGAVGLQLPAGQLSLQLRFAADSWVEIYDGSGKSVLYDLGKAGTDRVVTGAAPLSVTLGNAPAVTLQVNGRPVTPPAPPPGQTVARFSVGADGLPR